MIEITNIEYKRPVFGEWINSPTLPDDNAEVLLKCTTKSGTIFYDLGVYLYSIEQWLRFKSITGTVLAWTPLPDERESENE